MALSLDGMASVLDAGSTRVNSAQDHVLKNSVNKLSANSSEEELKGVLKDFESYFVEQMLKELKETFTDSDKDADSTAARYKDFFMDTAIEQVADQLVDEIGSGLTQQLYEQMRRNYGMTDSE